jgi:hypothetical protein
VDEIKKYDGTALYATEIEVNEKLQNLKNLGYSWSVIFGGAQTDVGESDSSVTYFVLYDANHNDVTNKYNISKQKGKLKVTAKDVIVIHPYSLQYVYDGTTRSYYALLMRAR